MPSVQAFQKKQMNEISFENYATFSSKIQNSNSMKRVAIDSCGIFLKNIQLKGQIDPVSQCHLSSVAYLNVN